MCVRHDVADLMTRENYAEWLSWNVSREDLASRVERIFREKGPVLPSLVRRDLEWFIEDRSARALAECVASNEEPGDFEGFRAWCRDLSGEPRDPHARAGVNRADFCEDKGPEGT